MFVHMHLFRSREWVTRGNGSEIANRFLKWSYVEKNRTNDILPTADSSLSSFSLEK